MKPVFILIFLLCPFFHYGQIINNGSVISISNNTSLFITSDFTNNGTIINNGDFFISGAWTNNNIYQEGQGTFVLSSTADQVVNHNAQSFTNLRIVGGGTKFFLADLTVTESLSLLDGKLVSQNNSKLIIARDAEVVGGSPDSYIQGVVKREGPGTHFFPVGNSSDYLPVSLTQVKGNLAEISIEVVSEPNIFQADSRFSTIDSSRVWEMQTSNYEGGYIDLPLIGNNNFSEIEALSIIGTDSAKGEISNYGVFEFSGSLTDGTVSSNEEVFSKYLAIAELYGETISGRDINVYNIITPNADGIHDFLKIQNIEEYPENVVIIYNKWGNKVWETKAYDNQLNVFEGKANNGAELITGNYYYTISKGNGDKSLSGYLYIQR